MDFKNVSRTFSVLLLGWTLASGFHLQVFKDLNFKGLIYEVEDASDVGCHNLKPYARGSAGSVQLNRCIMAYEGLDCQGKSVKLQPATTQLSNLMKPISSYSACNASYGGNKIRVDFLDVNNGLLTEYVNICDCQDIPSQVSSNARKLHNYGNCVKVYQTDSCGGASKEIPAGKNDDSEDLQRFGSYVRSIGPCGDEPVCLKLHSQVYKFVILDDEDTLRALEANGKKVELATKTTFYNNGSATVTQVYEASKKVKEVFSVSRSKAITNMFSSTVEKTTETEVKMNLIFVSASVKTTLREAYTMEHTEENTEEETYTREEEKEFTVRQTIQIPECAEYQVSSMVSIIDNLPIKYQVYTKVTGTLNGNRMLSADVQKHVTDMTYLPGEDIDEYTAVYMTQHNIVANVGVDTFISGEGLDIQGCTIRNICPKQENTFDE